MQFTLLVVVLGGVCGVAWSCEYESTCVICMENEQCIYYNREGKTACLHNSFRGGSYTWKARKPNQCRDEEEASTVPTNTPAPTSSSSSSSSSSPIPLFISSSSSATIPTTTTSSSDGSTPFSPSPTLPTTTAPTNSKSNTNPVEETGATTTTIATTTPMQNEIIATDAADIYQSEEIQTDNSTTTSPTLDFDFESIPDMKNRTVDEDEGVDQLNLTIPERTKQYNITMRDYRISLAISQCRQFKSVRQILRISKGKPLYFRFNLPQCVKAILGENYYFH